MLTGTHYGTSFVHASIGTLYLFVEEAEAFMSSEGHSCLSSYAKEPSGKPHRGRVVAGRELVTRDEDRAMYPVDALRRAWFRGKFYVHPVQGDSLAYAFKSGGIPFPRLSRGTT